MAPADFHNTSCEVFTLTMSRSNLFLWRFIEIPDPVTHRKVYFRMGLNGIDIAKLHMQGLLHYVVAIIDINSSGSSHGRWTKTNLCLLALQTTTSKSTFFSIFSHIQSEVCSPGRLWKPAEGFLAVPCQSFFQLSGF